MEQKQIKDFKIQSSIIASVIILFGLVAILIILRKCFCWPETDSEKTILIGIFIFSLLPFIINLVDVIIKRGGKIEFGSFKFDLSETEISKITIPTNIGMYGQPVNETSTKNIIDTLRKATSNDIVIVDLEDGKAWWETRLLVLLSGADRLGRPDKIVFVANKAEKQQYFIGWAHPNNLLKCLLTAHPKYPIAYYIAKSVANQWNLVEPLYSIPPQNILIPPALPWMQSKAIQNSNMAYNGNTGLPNEFFEEQILQNELGREIEVPEGGKYITMGRIIDLFESILYTSYIDLNESSEQQVEKLLKEDVPFIALTQNGRYTSLVSRFALYNEVLRGLAHIKE